MLARGDIVDGKYRVVRLLGEGGMGAVYEGYNVRLDRPVAIKVMHAALAEDRGLVKRFEREARAAAKIGSSHIVDVFDLGDLPSGDRFMVMEFLEGESLLARMKNRGVMTPLEVAPIGIQLLDGLAKVHEAGIIHRDLKPANIFLTSTDGGADFVKILDFGICKVSSKRKSEVSTGVGTLMGTLAYMCPEQIEHGPKGLDGRADLYAVGVMLYRCVTGKLPYRAPHLVALLQAMRAGRPPLVRDLAPEVDETFSAIIDKAIEWDPDARFGNAVEFKEALEAWQDSVSRIERLLTDFLEAPAAAKHKSAKAPPRARLKSTTTEVDGMLAAPEPAGAEAQPSDASKPMPARVRRRTGHTGSTKVAPKKPAAEPDDDDDDAVTIPKFSGKL